MKNINLRNFLLSLFIIVAFASVVNSCSSGKANRPKTAESVFKEAVEEYDDDDYIEAKTLFDVIKLQYPASQYADDAQYYLAEINLKRQEYILGAFNYNLLRKIYPSSDYAKECLYKNAFCYYKLSPKAQRDQKYTHKAIKAFQEFQQLYPTDSLYGVSSKNIDELREKLAEREFQTAELYIKMEYLNASVVYYDEVINKFDDTKYYEPAYFGKISVLYKMKKYDLVIGLSDLYIKFFPSNSNASSVKDMKATAIVEYKKIKAILN